MKHPLDRFAYCPVCGSKRFPIHNFKSRRCEDCGFVYYANVCASTAAFIVNDSGELLVVRRAKNPAKGTLDLPGGFVDMNENVEEGMRREILEETGIQVDEVKYLFSYPNVYPYSGIDVHTLDMDFLVRVPSHTRARAADDAAECIWLPLRSVRPEAFGLTSIRHAVERFLDYARIR